MRNRIGLLFARLFLASSIDDRRAVAVARGLVLASALALMLPGAWGNSATVVEFAALPAGLAAWQSHSLGIYRVCGPVGKLLYALPASLAGVRVDYPSAFDSNVQGRDEWELGEIFQRQHVKTYHEIYRWSRLLPIVVTLLAGGLICEWSTRLLGAWPGVVSMAAWCWLPPVLGHGAVVTSDVISAAAMLAAARLFWAFLLKPNRALACASGAALGLAGATKFTLLVLYPCWAVLLLCRVLENWGRSADDRRSKPPSPTRMIALALVMSVTSILVFDGCYGFHGVGFRLASWTPRHSSLGDQVKLVEDQPALAWMLEVPLPVPLEALRGIDVQLADTERLQSAYLLGSTRLGGWWYWYPAAALFKIPLPAWGLFILALVHWPGIVRQGGERVLWGALCLLLPALETAAAIVASTGTGSNAAFRYMLPTIALLCVVAGAAAAAGSRTSRGLVKLFLAWLALNAALGVPDQLGWRNELGWAWERSTGQPVLIGDSLDWGQDLARLAAWVERHAAEGSTSVCVYGFGDGEPYGLCNPSSHIKSNKGYNSRFVAASVGMIYGYDSYRSVEIGHDLPEVDQRELAALKSLRRYDCVGRSVYIYLRSDVVQQSDPRTLY